MNKSLLILTSTIILSFQAKSFAQSATIKSEKRITSETPDVAIALKFINGWVQNCNKMKGATGIIEWINSNKYATVNFKHSLTKLVKDAYKRDKELGLDFDPIFDAQDYPEEGFKVESVDKKTGYLVVVDKKTSTFKVTMKLIKTAGNNWLVDGSGVINIPKNKQSAR